MVSVLVSSAVDHWWCNGERARLECCRSLVRSPVGSSQRLLNWYLHLLREGLSFKE
jgi:hypothetical protein